jgi:O-antigen ligase
LALFVVIGIIDLFINGVKPLNKFPKLLLALIVFYLLHIISAFYSENTDAAVFDLEVKFSFLVLPILFGFQKADLNIRLTNTLRLYLIASFLAASFMLLMNVDHYFETGKWFHYIEFSFLLHPSYLSLYFSFSILVGIYLLKIRGANILCVISTIILSLGNIVFAESKAAVLALLVLFIYLVFKLIIPNHRKIAAGISIIIILLFGAFANKIDRFSSISYTLEHYKQISANPEKAVESTALRFLAWESAISIIGDNPILGVGNGDIHTELSKAYKERKVEKALSMNMNAHNQYLETAVGQGLIGLSCLIIMLVIPLFSSKTNTILIQGFILLIGINIMVESMFNTQAGVLFIAFFYSFLISQTLNSGPIYHGSISIETIE